MHQGPYGFANSLARTPSLSSASATGNPQPRLTALQRQRKQMRAQFTFPNGEVFTPRVSTPLPGALGPAPVPVAPVAPVAPAPLPLAQSEEQSPRKRLGRLFRGMLGRDKKEEKVQTPIPTLALPVVVRPAKDETQTILQRLERDWDTVHVNEPHSASLHGLHSTSLGGLHSTSLNGLHSPSLNGLHSTSLNGLHSTSLSSLSVSSEVSSPGREEGVVPSPKASAVHFAADIFVGETFAQGEYARADPEEWGDAPEGSSSSSSSFTSSAKMEVNAYKQYEMFVHPESRRYTHFFA